MVTRLFARSSGNSHASHTPPNDPPPPPPASHKPKFPISSTVGKPPRRRPTNLPLAGVGSSRQFSISPQSPPTSHHPIHSSRTPPASTFRNAGLQPPSSHTGRTGYLATGEVTDENNPWHQPYPGVFTGYNLDLTRARSDESLLWTAEEEATALVAELRASLSCNSGNAAGVASNCNAASDTSINTLGRYSHNPQQHHTEVAVAPLPNFNSQQRSKNSYLFHHQPIDGIHRCGSNQPAGGDQTSHVGQFTNAVEVCAQFQCPPARLPNPFQRSFSVHRRPSDARSAAQKLNLQSSSCSSSQPLRSHSFTDLQSAVELMPLHTAATKQASPAAEQGSSLQSFGGSWKSLLRGEF